ncbi:MAG: aldo/keto reductase, partial [Clostridia bacterium]|nr:aldo/keto reductase [Clostridia bacterium]
MQDAYCTFFEKRAIIGANKAGDNSPGKRGDSMESIKLNNGTIIPVIGLGTFLMEPDDAEKAAIAALRGGYTLIDTANAYMNEKAVGRAIRASGIQRDNIYLSTKLWPSVYAQADKAIECTLKRLGTDVIDLLFLHQPVGDYIGAYKAMERAVKTGKVRSLGLSNFPMEKLMEVTHMSEIPPAVVQVEAHPYHTQTALKTCL